MRAHSAARRRRRRPPLPSAHPAAGENRLTWPSGCCEGDLIIIDFRDEQADGNNGRGMLYINRTDSPSTFVETHHITCVARQLRPRRRAAPPARPVAHTSRTRPRSGQLGYTWKTYGPFCAPEGWHNFSYISDANPTETTFKIRDSFGLVKAQGDMTSFPVRFHTIAPSKFCVPDDGLEGLSDELMAKRVQKLLAYNDQYKPAAQLREEGWAVPQDYRGPDGGPLTVHDNSVEPISDWAW